MRIQEYLGYTGPNRRSENTNIEWLLEISEAELIAFRQADEYGLRELRRQLDRYGIQLAGAEGSGRNPLQRLAALIVQIAVSIQRLGGHRVGFTTVIPAKVRNQCRVVYEYEQFDCGIDAGEIALRLLAETTPGLEWAPEDDVPGEGFAEALELFLGRSPGHVFPPDAQAIMDAAARLDVPCVKLERLPYGEVPGEFRIRRNGMLKLGHSRYQTVVDGTLSMERNEDLVPLLFDREKLHEVMARLGLPQPGRSKVIRQLLTPRRAVRAARRIGFPVVLKPVTRHRKAKDCPVQPYPALASASEVQEAFEKATQLSRMVIVEEHIAGTPIHVLVANHQVICALDGTSGHPPDAAVHQSILDMAVALSKEMNCGLLTVSVVTRKPCRPLQETGGAVVDIDFAPQLDSLLPPDSPLVAQAAEQFVRWLYPEGEPSRIPLVAVTGTNGKTTTVGMIARVMSEAGYDTGYANTHGVFIDGELLQTGDLAGGAGHHRLFESPAINMGVLETARGAVAHTGLMFDWCNVAVCLNVTPDHLGQFGIETVEQMTEIKRSILQRARYAVVLNADYETCRAMLPFEADRKTYLASLKSGLSEIREVGGKAAIACVIENDQGSDWIVIHQADGSRHPVMPVAELPAAMGGTAGFNVSNAQHAICASHALGVPADAIRSALAGFEASYENTPGRLNFYHELPFTVVMDYAHNTDGMAQLISALEHLDVPGRKILLYAVTSSRTDEAIAEFARSPIGFFDHFFCRRYVGKSSALRPETPHLMKESLRQAGVGQDRITLVEEPEEGARKAMSLARPGDLVVLCPGTAEIKKMWHDVTSFQPDGY